MISKIKKAQERVQGLISRMIEDGDERGLQAAAYLDGELVLDAWDGVLDPVSGRKVDGETLFPVFSTTKGITATVIHILAERGKLDYDTPIAHYWPEFAAHGKGGITIRHALTHTSGVPQLPETGDIRAVAQWPLICAMVADLKPLWPAGTKFYYHALTYGWLLGELARRVDGRAFGMIVQDEICRPLKINSLFVGIPGELESRVATLEAAPVPPPPVSAAPPDPIANLSVPPWLRPLEWLMNRPDIRRACVPGGGGIMNAKAIARHYAALLGSVDGVRLLSSETLAQATVLNFPGKESYEELQGHYGLGYALYGGRENPALRFGHGGHGGSLGMADMKYRLAIGITKNMMGSRLSPPPAERIVSELRDALEMPV